LNIRAILGFTLLFSLTAGIATAEPIVIRFSHVVAEQTPKGSGADRFKQLVEEKLAGRVKVEVFPRAKLYNDDEVFIALLNDDIQLAAPSLSKFSTITKALEVYDLPFLFNDQAAVERFQHGAIGQQLLNALDDKGFKGLGYWPNGMRVISANKPLRSPADLRALTLRIEPSKVIATQYERLGAIPIKLPFSHTRDALRRELVEGQENSWSNIYSQGFQTLQTHITETNHSFQGYMLISSKTFWNGLPPDVRGELDTILAQVTAEVKVQAAEQASHDRQAIIAAGKPKLIALTEAEQAQWRQAMTPVWTLFAKRIDPAIMAAAQAANHPGP